MRIGVEQLPVVARPAGVVRLPIGKRRPKTGIPNRGGVGRNEDAGKVQVGACGPIRIVVRPDALEIIRLQIRVV